MSPAAPLRFILFHGDERGLILEGLQEVLAAWEDPSGMELNLSRLEGAKTSLDELYQAVNALPFLSDRRLTVVSDLAPRLLEKESAAAFRKLLEGMPESTTLVVTLEDDWDRSHWMHLGAKHWLRTWIEEQGSAAALRECRPPGVREMPGWIMRRVKAGGGEITPPAAAALAGQVGNDTTIALQEIEKLLLYANGRPIQPADVQLLTAQTAEPDIFAMVDALGTGNGGLALNLLHRLLEDEDVNPVFGMVVRQFRLLLQMREALDQGLSPDRAAGELNIHPYVAGKLAQQAQRFSLQRLKEIYRRLRLMDEESKGKVPLPIALDTFVAELTR